MRVLQLTFGKVIVHTSNSICALIYLIFICIFKYRQIRQPHRAWYILQRASVQAPRHLAISTSTTLATATNSKAAGAAAAAAAAAGGGGWLPRQLTRNMQISHGPLNAIKPSVLSARQQKEKALKVLELLSRDDMSDGTLNLSVLESTFMMNHCAVVIHGVISHLPSHCSQLVRVAVRVVGRAELVRYNNSGGAIGRDRDDTAARELLDTVSTKHHAALLAAPFDHHWTLEPELTLVACVAGKVVLGFRAGLIDAVDGRAPDVNRFLVRKTFFFESNMHNTIINLRTVRSVRK